MDGFLKLTTQFSSKVRLFVMGGFRTRIDRSTVQGRAPRIETIFSKENNRRMTGTANLSYQIGSNSILDIRAGISKFNYPIAETAAMKEAVPYGVGFNDGYTGYSWGYPQSWASDIHRTNIQGRRG